jgi:dipeptidyl aminopeptidase/acylaminoacyl peptidase
MDHEPRFWSLPEGEAGGEPLPSSDGKWIAYISDAADDWDHLYIAAADGGEPIELTSGHSEAWRPAWSHDSQSLAFDTNESDHPGSRRIGIVTVGADASHPTLRYVTTLDGTNTEPLWSPQDTQLVYQHTDWLNSADLYAVSSTGSTKPTRLTNSMPAELDKSLLVKPQYVTFPGADGTPVPGWLFLPKNLDQTKKHAAIVWIHGDGINQNLRRLAHSAKLRGLLQLPPVFAAAGICGLRSGLPREHRLRKQMALSRLYGCWRQGC